MDLVIRCWDFRAPSTQSWSLCAAQLTLFHPFSSSRIWPPRNCNYFAVVNFKCAQDNIFHHHSYVDPCVMVRKAHCVKNATKHFPLFTDVKNSDRHAFVKLVQISVVIAILSTLSLKIFLRVVMPATYLFWNSLIKCFWQGIIYPGSINFILSLKPSPSATAIGRISLIMKFRIFSMTSLERLSEHFWRPTSVNCLLDDDFGR